MVGTVFCVGVMGMYHSGIGGGGFMLVRAANGSYEFIDFRETAPANASQNMYDGNYIGSTRSGLASGVPGELRGLQELHDKYGVLAWKEVMLPAVKLAREGFRVTEDLVRYMASGGLNQSFVEANPTWALDFAPNGTLLGLNDTIYRKRYANTLETIAEYGPDAFYTGAIAETMIETLQKENGTMTMADLANYTVAIREPAEIEYRGYKIRSCSAPASGTVALSALKIVEGYEDFGDTSQIPLDLNTHRLDEAIKFGYGRRAHLGDPSFLSNMTAYQATMLSPSFAADVRGMIIDSHTQNVSAYDTEGLESLETPGTSHIVTADDSGLAVTLTTTINLLFGNKIMVPSTGIIMNNEMNDFSIPGSSNAFGYIPSPANYVRPGKRPLSSITPTIVEYSNGSLYFVVGAAGGSRILTSTIQNLWHVLDQNMTAYEALAHPRFHDQLQPNEMRFEWAYDNATTADMEARGHNVTWNAPGESAAQALRLTVNGTWEAAGEPRQRNSEGVVV